MKKPFKIPTLNSGLNKQQQSTLELWQQHLAALSRASQARPYEMPMDESLLTQQTYESYGEQTGSTPPG